jgi:hypothetical protein
LSQCAAQDSKSFSIKYGNATSNPALFSKGLIVGPGTIVPYLWITNQVATKYEPAYRAELFFSKASDRLFFGPFIKVENQP